MFKLILTLMLTTTFTIGSTFASVNQQTNFISTHELAQQMGQSDLQDEVKAMLSEDEFKKILTENGYTLAQMEQRLATMSTTELQDLKADLDQAQAGGILATILVDILIIYFAQRI